ncbi:serine/threonine-protein kinase [Streptomyces clavuligerus]|uniref:serine/threonine-protein kinase n=1 Tax=Streptomyces clavuligerus TaxID=1901 RepID=UPI00020D91E2|nr:serine/threonine protein kinase [Streptomyces clavuligerus]AXU13128.1 serine/threonine protein kinase [Streptomyces clavuligerus]MBY6303070.1 protein kinase [Streptomyces clavuligerus]QCS05911.1 serine/threonine protein kinase [Streptomyces clavuligerus]QPJ94724.1 protein kinase [Streptomyces clavuligerus]
MSEAEQSRKPQQDKSTAPGPERTGETSGGARGDSGPGTPGGRTAAGGADAGTDAGVRPGVEPEDPDSTAAAPHPVGRPAAGALLPRQADGREPAGARSGERGATGGRQASATGSGAATGRSAPGSGTPARGTGEARGARGGDTGGGQVSEGRLLAGRYRLGAVLGRGGMGTVWRAEDETLGRTVAVKELRFPNSIDEEEKRRLITRTLREAKAIARIRNNNAVTVFDVVDEDDRPWIVMELVEGRSLAEVIREDGTLTPRRAAEVGLAILDVLRAAHRQGILHRDVKPSNVLIADEGRVVLTDFGIAQVEGDPSITSTGMLVGAPSYISPERARGHRPGPAADLWSLGGLLYASVEGCPPYDKGSAIATLTAVMTEPLDPPGNAGPLEEVIYGLLAKDPALRLDDAGARALLTKALSAPDTPVRPEPPVDATRAMALPPIPPPPAAPLTRPVPPRRPAPPRPVGPVGAGPVSRAPGQPAPMPPVPPVQRAAPVRAPLTDVVPRRTMVIIAVVVALAVAATVLYLTIGPEDKGAGDGGKKETADSAGVTASSGSDATPDGGPGSPAASGGEGTGDTPGGTGEGQGGTGTGKDTENTENTEKDEKDGTDGKEEEEAAEKDAGDEAGKPGGVPEGFQQVSNDRFRFQLAMPEGFRMTKVAGQGSGGVYSENGGFPRVQVDFTATPGDDAAAAWNAAVPGVRGSSSQYRHIGVKEVEFNGYPTVADWEFERTQGGERVRVLNRGFKVDGGRGYAIMISCPAADWNKPECEKIRTTAFTTFKPKG